MLPLASFVVSLLSLETVEAELWFQTGPAQLDATKVLPPKRLNGRQTSSAPCSRAAKAIEDRKDFITAKSLPFPQFLCLIANTHSKFLIGKEHGSFPVITSLTCRFPTKGGPHMCDFSLQSVRSRQAKVGDQLVTRSFGTGTRGFAAIDDAEVAVCLMPGTELAFADEIAVLSYGLLGNAKTISYRTAIFRQINREKIAVHHDALEFPDGRIELLTMLCEGQTATVLQLPAQPMSAKEAIARERAACVG